MTIKFFLQSNRNPAPIYVRIRGAKNVDAKARTQWSINPSNWSRIKGKPKSLSDANYKKLNNDLENFSKDLSNAINNLEYGDPIKTPWLKNYINPPEVTESSIPLELTDYIDYYIKLKEHEVSSNTVQKWEVIKHKLENFEQERKQPILIKHVDEAFKNEFVRYSRQKGYSVNTIHRAIGFIKTFCRNARYNGLKTHEQLDGLKCDKEKSKEIYLTFDELEKIEKADIDSKSLQNARNWLIISCYCGQRVSDFLNFHKGLLRKVKIEANEDVKDQEVTLIEFTQKKTGKVMSVPLHQKILDILKVNKGEFPYKIADQKYNEHIKEVCKIAKLTEKVKGSKMEKKRKKEGMYPKNELVTSHIGRRSFASNFYGKIPTALLISATGHSTEKMFLDYIGKSSTDQALELAIHFRKL